MQVEKLEDFKEEIRAIGATADRGSFLSKEFPSLAQTSSIPSNLPAANNFLLGPII